jgi:hypothetical protein
MSEAVMSSPATSFARFQGERAPVRGTSRAFVKIPLFLIGAILSVTAGRIAVACGKHTLAVLFRKMDAFDFKTFFPRRQSARAVVGRVLR